MNLTQSSNMDDILLDLDPVDSKNNTSYISKKGKLTLFVVLMNGLSRSRTEQELCASATCLLFLLVHNHIHLDLLADNLLENHHVPLTTNNENTNNENTVNRMNEQQLFRESTSCNWCYFCSSLFVYSSSSSFKCWYICSFWTDLQYPSFELCFIQ